MCIELRGAGSGASDGWSEGFLCVHPYRTYETAGMMGALNWGGHQMTVTPRAQVEAMCADASDSADHEKETARFLFRVHLFGTGCDVTLRSESTGTLVTTFLQGVRFDRRRVVAWHKQRSSKLLTAASAMFTPPEGGALEEWALHPVRRTPDGLVSDDFSGRRGKRVAKRANDGDAGVCAVQAEGRDVLGVQRVRRRDDGVHPGPGGGVAVQGAPCLHR